MAHVDGPILRPWKHIRHCETCLRTTSARSAGHRRDYDRRMPPRIAVVTGASSGIGHATAVALAERGVRVIGTSRNPDTVPDALRHPGIEFHALDLADDASIEAFADKVGDVDILINNAGESQSGPFEELPAEAIRRLFRINVFGQVRLTQLLLPGMRERRYGRIVMVGSMLASFPLAYRSSYVSSKAAIKAFAEAARLEVSPYGVWISTLEPGSISTGISERRTKYVDDGSPYDAEFRKVISILDRNEAKGITAERVAAKIVHAVDAKQPKPFYAVGSRAPVNFTLRRLAPRSVIETMIAKSYGLRR